MDLGLFGSLFCQSVSLFITGDANMCRDPLEHYLIVLAQGAQAVVKLPGGEVSGARHERLKSRQRVSQEYQVLLAVSFIQNVLGRSA